MKKTLQAKLKKWALRNLNINHDDLPSKPVRSPDLYPFLDIRLAFGSVAMVRNPNDVDSCGKPRWRGPVEIHGCDTDTHTYITPFGNFCYARTLTEEEKDRHAKYWQNSLGLKP